MKKEKTAKVYGRTRKYKILHILGISACLVMVILLVILAVMQWQEEITMDQLRNLYHDEEATRPYFSLIAGAKAETVFDAQTGELPDRFKDLWETNNDLIGWLKVGNLVDEPVVYRDNEYYLNHNFRQAKSKEGAVFADVENADWGTDSYVILYGHNRKKGGMFGKLSQYQELRHMQENAVIQWDTLQDDAARNYVVFSVFDASMLPGDHNYFFLRRFDTCRSGNVSKIQAFLEEIQERSLLNIPVEVRPQDRILVLVTCSYADPDGRLMVFFRALRENETEEDLQARVAQSAAH